MIASSNPSWSTGATYNPLAAVDRCRAVRAGEGGTDSPERTRPDTTTVGGGPGERERDATGDAAALRCDRDQSKRLRNPMCNSAWKHCSTKA